MIKQRPSIVKMKKIIEEKLLEKGLEEELTRLNELRLRLKEFGKDLWEKSLEDEKRTTEDLYFGTKNKLV